MPFQARVSLNRGTLPIGRVFGKMANDVNEGYRALFLTAGRYMGAQALVAVSTAIALWVGSRWGTGPVDMIFLPAVLAAAVRWGFGPAILAGLTSALAYNYFFTEPLYTFRISSVVDIVDVTVLFLVAAVVSQLASATRRQAQIAETHAIRNATIAGFARRLISSSSEAEVAEGACEEISTLFNCNAVIMAGLPRPERLGAAPKDVTLTPTDVAAAVQSLRSGEISGRGSASLAPADWVFHPIRSESAIIAVMGLSRDDGLAPVNEAQLLLLDSLLDQTALGLARAREAMRPDRKKTSLN
jgi:two-component system, OmpR family, sensor histidine kinase KdpD